MDKKTKIAVVDDHHLFRDGIVKLIHSLDHQFEVTLQANNGREFIESLTDKNLPDVAVIDINMPIMDGYETVANLKKLYPEILILILTMNDDEMSLIRMLKLGVNGYIGKDIEPVELKEALCALLKTGHYYNDQLTQNLIQSITSPDSEHDQHALLSDKELKFVELACSEHTYAHIAQEMFLSPKTIDGYRASVFEKLQVKTRVGLVMYAIKVGIYEL